MTNTVAVDLVNFLEDCHVDAAFGVSGGFIFPFWEALSDARSINLFHCRHEAGSVYSASEYSLSRNRPTVAFATAGPGLTNALTALNVARVDGSQVIFISAITPDTQSGTWPLQETTREGVSRLTAVSGQGFFDHLYVVSDLDGYYRAKKAIVDNLQNAAGACIGLFITTAVQKTVVPQVERPSFPDEKAAVAAIRADLRGNAQALAAAIMANNALFWLGFGARHAASEIQQLVTLSQAEVISTPRGKGIFPDDHPRYRGASGLGSDSETIARMLSVQCHPVVVIMGSRLGELSSSYMQRLLTDSQVFIVGLNCHEVAGNVPPQTVFIDCDIRALLRYLIPLVEQLPARKPVVATASSPRLPDSHDLPGFLHPLSVMQVVQQIVIDRHNGYVAAEAGNSFVWTNRYLTFREPCRYRISPGLGAMGHYASGVIGLTANQSDVVVAIVGDGAMLMSNEVSTAVRYHLPAIWLVMNDGCYNMCRQGLAMLGGENLDCEMPVTDFALLGESLGAKGYRVSERSQFEQALLSAIAERQPTVIDMRIDRSAIPPLTDRINTLREL